MVPCGVDAGCKLMGRIGLMGPMNNANWLPSGNFAGKPLEAYPWHPTTRIIDERKGTQTFLSERKHARVPNGPVDVQSPPVY